MFLQTNQIQLNLADNILKVLQKQLRKKNVNIELNDGTFFYLYKLLLPKQ